MQFNLLPKGRTAKQSPTSSSSCTTSPNGCLLVEESLLKSSSLLLQNKSIDNLSAAASSSLSSSSCGRDLNAIRSFGQSNERTLHELHNLNGGGIGHGSGPSGGGVVHGPAGGAHRSQSKDNASSSCVATPSSCYSADSSLDAKSNRSHDCLTGGGGGDGSKTGAGASSCSRKRVNYRPDFATPLSSRSAVGGDMLSGAAGETGSRSAMLTGSGLLLVSGPATAQSTPAADTRQLSFSRYTDTIISSSVCQQSDDSGGRSYLTMTGTVKRGRKKGQSVDLQINMSRDELERINAAALLAVAADDEAHQQRGGAGSGGGGGAGNSGVGGRSTGASGCCRCTRTVGLHVLLLSLVCAPFVALATGVYSFYIGTLTWYNMFNYVTEERSVCVRVLVSPVLVLLYPLLIVLCTLGLGVYAGCAQLSVRFHSWLNEVGDVEKGFYGWLCSVLRMSDCSPYEVVVLVDLQMAAARAGADSGCGGGSVSGAGGMTSTEELSL